MGMDQRVLLPAGTKPSWPPVAELLAAHHFPVKVLMIDGELAFPDEQPPSTWRELRIGTPQGMVTLRREDDAIRLTTWGNADTPLLQAWNALTWAVAEVFGGAIEMANAVRNTADFRRQSDMPIHLSIPEHS